MPSLKTHMSPRPPAETDWRLKKIRHLEVELRHLKEYLSNVSLNNANQLLVITQIYNITSVAQEKSPALAAVKRLIEQNNINLNAATKSLPGSILSTGGDGTLTPPTSSPDSQLSAAMNSDDASVEDSNDENVNRGSQTGPPGKTNGQPDLFDFLLGGDKRETDGKEELLKAEGETNIGDDDDIFQEYTLEEELEGIADAPAKDRAAMRVALRQKEDARRKTMRQSADEKRRLAEKEGLQLRRTLLRPAAQVKSKLEIPRSAEQANHSNNNNNKNNHDKRDHGAAYTAVPKPAETTPKAATSTPMTGYVDSDDDDGEKPKYRYCRKQWLPNNVAEANLSSGMISVESTSPKNAHRYGIMFDPSKLDAEETAQISGAVESNDTRRSVLIRNIPHEYSMHKLLAHVRGGAIVMARLVPDTVSVGQGQVAIVTFKTAQEANACNRITAALLARGEASESPVPDPESRVHVSLLPTPTYPSRETVVSARGANSGLAIVEEATRCLFVTEFPKRYINNLCTELLFGVQRFPSKMHALEEMWFAGDTLHMQFTSMQEAAKARRIISFFHFGKYSAQVHFGPDPCAGHVGNMKDLFNNGALKLASHGFMGLKSLLETVGLAAYSRNQEKLYAQKVKPATASAPSKAPYNAFTLRTKTAASSRSGPGSVLVPSVPNEPANILIDFSFDCAEDTSNQTEKSVKIASAITTPVSTNSTPWTEDLMVGLDRL